MTTTKTTWYHGTSSESGLDAGDYLNPRKGNFEACVWATSSKKAAMTYAKDACVVHGGEPVVFQVVLPESATVIVCKRGGDMDYKADADAIIDEQGEQGVATLAILSGVAHVEDCE